MSGKKRKKSHWKYVFRWFYTWAEWAWASSSSRINLILYGCGMYGFKTHALIWRKLQNNRSTLWYVHRYVHVETERKTRYWSQEKILHIGTEMVTIVKRKKVRIFEKKVIRKEKKKKKRRKRTTLKWNTHMHK